MSADVPGMAEKRRRKLHVLADHLTLTDDERIEFSKAILWRDMVSWKGLDDGQVGRLLDALEGAEKFVELMRQRV
jgi:hypothetical protein